MHCAPQSPAAQVWYAQRLGAKSTTSSLTQQVGKPHRLTNPVVQKLNSASPTASRSLLLLIDFKTQDTQKHDSINGAAPMDLTWYVQCPVRLLLCG